MEPVQVDEPVCLQAYSPLWPALFGREGARIRDALPGIDAAIEHIGSTAVPGLDGKPVIDIQLGLATYPPSDDRVSAALESLGYESLGEAGVQGRLYFRLRAANAFNLHVMQRGGPLWRSNLALREHLRADPEARQAYARAKKAAIAGGAHTLCAYSNAKADVIRELLKQAQASTPLTKTM